LRAEQIDSLEALARQVVGQMELRKANFKLKDRFEELQDVIGKVLTAQRLLVQASKMSALGEMAAGIAHEINNPLAVVRGASSLLKKFKDNPEKFESKLATINSNIERIAKIISGLGKFARMGQGAPHQPYCLAQIIREALTIIEAKSKRNLVPIKLDLQSENQILCDSIEIEQVIVNLVSNAIDAVKELPEKWVKLSLFRESAELVVQVKDSGSGIPLEIKEKIFQPFFTTKIVGQGTGLGLSISKGILDEHKASIEVTEKGKYTCFEIRFAVCDGVKNAS
jgi:C4-dicarboxylate-specific signal transduction histidine kinase